jgi:predicted phosphate transport protein (TIGR00153 family)
MEKVTECVQKVQGLFQALEKKDYTLLEQIANEISELEHAADLTKNDIRNHLPKSLYLAIDREGLLEILAIQDSIADKAEDISVLMTLKKLEMPSSIKNEFNAFLEKNIECFNGARLIIKELYDLLESSFGGFEAEKVRKMVDDVSFKEHEVDLLQRSLLRSFFNSEDELKSYSSFHLWQKIFAAVSDISNLSEKLAYRIRMNLEIK